MSNGLLAAAGNSWHDAMPIPVTQARTVVSANPRCDATIHDGRSDHAFDRKYGFEKTAASVCRDKLLTVLDCAF
jgi:hypothetical protein